MQPRVTCIVTCIKYQPTKIPCVWHDTWICTRDVGVLSHIKCTNNVLEHDFGFVALPNVARMAGARAAPFARVTGILDCMSSDPFNGSPGTYLPAVSGASVTASNTY
jgi:hypothetical protein